MEAGAYGREPADYLFPDLCYPHGGDPRLRGADRWCTYATDRDFIFSLQYPRSRFPDIKLFPGAISREEN